MNAEPSYTPYHPKWYRSRVSVWWWLQKAVYTRFVLRELTSLSVAFFALILLWKLHALRAGPDAYDQFLGRMKSPLFLVLNGIALIFVLFHTLTWFSLAPKAMVMRVGGKRVPDRIVSGLNYLAWLVLSIGVAWLSQRG